MEERRKLPRKYLMAYSSVYSVPTGRLIGYLCDITLDGLMVISKEDMALDRELEVRIDLPEIPEFTQSNLKLKTKAVRSQPDIDPRLFNIGFQLLDIAPESKPVIEQMIETYEFRRYTDETPEK